MRATILFVLVTLFVVGPADLWASQRGVPTDTELQALKQMASSIPLGSRVKVQTNRDRRFTGTLMSVTDDAVVIKKRTRLPEPAVVVPFNEVASLELQTEEGMSAGKVVGIGLAAGAGAILTLFVFFLALGGD